MMHFRLPRAGTKALAAGIGLMFATSAWAEPKTVIELFTSQGCSSCPEADKLLGELSRDPKIIALSMPIDYWDYLGWKDTLADPRFTARQKAYSKARGDRQVYTPQVIVNGRLQALGNDRDQVQQAISQTARTRQADIPVSLSVATNEIRVALPDSDKVPAGSHEVWICAVAASVPVTIGRGENRGKEVVYHNVVRNWLKVGDWNGKAAKWSVPLENLNAAGVDGAVVYVQEGNRDKPGAMIGASYATLRKPSGD